MTETRPLMVGPWGPGEGKGEEARIWHWQVLQCLVLAKKPRPERWGRRRKERGPVRGADGPAPGDPRAAAELPSRVLKTDALRLTSGPDPFLW